MKQRTCFIAVCLLAAFAVRTRGGEPLPAPVDPGSRLGHSLSEQFVNGPHAGTRRSLICHLAGRPAVLVYARGIDPREVELLRRLDAVALGGKDQNMTSACVLLTGKEEDLESLQALAQREKFGQTVLAATPLQWERPYFGSLPKQRNLQKEAAVTVILLQRLRVESSYAFREGELTARDVDEIVKAASALLTPLPR
jgi:hypothetical protein